MKKRAHPLQFTATLLALLVSLAATPLHAHQPQQSPTAQVTVGDVTYLGNEGLMVTSDDHKILFDPFFHNDFGTLQLVPDSIAKAIMSGQKPYDGIEAIFISHAHDDHFSAPDVKKFLRAHAQAKLIAPKQAVAELAKLADTAGLMSQVIAVDLHYGDAPWRLCLGDLEIEAVRIPHAGGADRLDIENLVYRVTINNKVTVMHLGDADPDSSHFTPFAAHWQRQLTDTAFPPYWFFLSPEGNHIIDHQINAAHAVGVHVPIKVPSELQTSGKVFFSKPSEQHAIEHSH